MITVVEVQPNADGPWDPESEVTIGDFASTEDALAFIRKTMMEEGWDPVELDAMPAPGTLGSRFQFVASS
jgi:hypothetical protein